MSESIDNYKFIKETFEFIEKTIARYSFDIMEPFILISEHNNRKTYKTIGEAEKMKIKYSEKGIETVISGIGRKYIIKNAGSGKVMKNLDDIFDEKEIVVKYSGKNKLEFGVDRGNFFGSVNFDICKSLVQKFLRTYGQTTDLIPRDELLATFKEVYMEEEREFREASMNQIMFPSEINEKHVVKEICDMLFSALCFYITFLN